MVEKINGPNPFVRGQQTNNTDAIKSPNSRADNIFACMDKSKDGFVSKQEANNFGFSTLGDEPLTAEQFRKKYQEYKDKTSNLEDSLKDFKELLYNDSEKEIVHNVNLNKEQQKELLSRMEMFNAYRQTLNEKETHELKRNKTEAMCFAKFKDDKPVPDDYEFPDDIDPQEYPTRKGLKDYKFVQLTEFLDGNEKDGFKDIQAKLKQGEETVSMSNSILSKILKLTSPNDIESDGKISGFRQGNVGDCWFLSALNNYASSQKGEENIKKRITNNNDGSYNVTFNNPFNQAEKEVYTISADELSKYGKSDWNYNKEKRFSNGDIDARIMEIATNKMLDKYLPDSERNNEDLPIECNSYIKDSLVHKALGYKDNVIYFQTKPDANGNYGNIGGFSYNLEKDENGKAKLGDGFNYETDTNSFPDLIKSMGYKNNELTCSCFYEKEYTMAKNDQEKIFILSNHAYNFMQMGNGEITISNPHYSAFPHPIKEEAFKNSFFDMITVYPQDNLIPVD